MRLKELKLKNIRSYQQEKIDFPEGSLLLRGDIGSGKSTLLLAIEFALFGLLRGEVEGASLLRHGAKEGTVELGFEVGDKSYVIQRNLKKGKRGISQQSGWLQTDDVRKEGTAQELKAWILEILGYPLEFLNKSKNLLYRYTVFTPQEEMKRILFEDREARLETLRKVFEVDKYKRIKENSKIYISHLRDEKKVLEGETRDLPSKKIKLKERTEELDAIKKKIETLNEKLEEAKKKTKEQARVVEEQEESVKIFQEINSKLEVARTEHRHAEEAIKRNQEQTEQTHEKLSVLREELKDSPEQDPKQIREEISSIKERINEENKKLKELERKKTELTTKRSSAQGLQDKINKLDTCPVCLQPVGPDHKGHINKQEAEKLKDIAKELSDISRKTDIVEKAKTDLEKRLEELRKQQQKAALSEAKKNNLQEKEKSLSELKEEKTKITEKQEELKRRIEELTEKRTGLKDVEQGYRGSKKKLEELRTRERQVEIEYNRLVKEKETLQNFLEGAAEEIEKKEKSKKRLQELERRQAWLNEHFTGLMDVMEKHILSRVHHEFDSLFQQWFQTLIEDELLSARLDDSFTPLIIQDGYEVDLGNLSGGEKTACALAYRLALNKVINEVVSTIKTKNLLILDEPTDGFSDQQLDKVRDVLEQLELEQIILVSHEHKIESMVNNVLQVAKRGHVSQVIG